MSVSGDFADGKTSVGGNKEFFLDDNKWAEFKIVMSGNKLVILKDGKLWQDLTLTDEGTAGALEMKFSGKYDTYVSDISVTTPTEQDLYTVVDADFQSEVYDNFCGIPVTYDSSSGGAKTTKVNVWQDSVIESGITGEYDFSVDFRYNLMNSWRGLRFITPTGNKYGFNGGSLMVGFLTKPE